jgi:phage tail-like protein
MAESKDTLKSSYPLPVFNYKVTIDSEVIGFAEISGLSLDYEPVIYKHGLSFLTGVKIIPGMMQPVRLTMKQGIVKNRPFLSEWFYNVYTDPFYSESKRDLQIDLCDEKGDTLIRWTVQRALPVKLVAPTFSAESNSVAIESMEVIAHGLQVDYNP